MPHSERARALIGWLALHPGSHHRTELASRLWPDAAEARANLRTAIWAVRTAWGPAATLLDSQRNSLGLTAGEIWVDVKAEPPTGEPLPSGVLLPGLSDDWLE